VLRIKSSHRTHVSVSLSVSFGDYPIKRRNFGNDNIDNYRTISHAWIKSVTKRD